MLRSASVSRFRASPLAGVFSGAEGIVSPLQLPGAKAWYDVSDLSSMRNDAGAIPSNGEGVKLISDKSGNSGVSVYVSNTAASNNVTSPNKSVTGNQTITLDLSMEDFTPAADRTVISKLSGNNGFEVLVLTTGVVRLRIGDGASVTNVDSTAANTLTNFTRGTLGIVWTDGVGASFTQNGAALGTAVAAVKTLTNAAVVCTIGNFVGTFWRVQVGSVYDCDPSQSASKRINNGDTFTSGGDTWTLVSAGATGGRITGARDLFQGTAANQPIYLPHSGTNYGYLNGTAGNLYSSPNAAALQVTGDIDVRAMLSMPTWTPATVMIVISKMQVAGNQCYEMYLDTAGRILFGISVDGTATSYATSSAATGFAASTTNWIRATRASASGTVTFYTSSDGSAWTQLGTTQATTSGAIFAGTNTLSLGAKAAGTFPLNGNLFRAQIYNGIAGTLAFDFNPAAYTSGVTFLDSSSNAATITINGGATIVNSTRLYFDGSNDYLKAAAFALAQPTTVYFAGSQVTWVSGDAFFDGNALGNGMAVAQNSLTPALSLFAGTQISDLIAPALNTRSVISAVFSGASSFLRLNRNTAASASVGVESGNGFTLGCVRNTTGFANITASEVLVYSTAQNTAQQDAVILYLGRHNGIAV